MNLIELVSGLGLCLVHLADLLWPAPYLACLNTSLRKTSMFSALAKTKTSKLGS